MLPSTHYLVSGVVLLLLVLSHDLVIGAPHYILLGEAVGDLLGVAPLEAVEE